MRLKIRLEPVEPYVALRHVRFSDVTELTAALERIVVEKSWDGERVDYLDGVVFSLDEAYLVLGTQTSEPGPVSDYTRDRIYYRSIQHPEGVSRDRLTIRDYLWRWDIDWFWCSRAFGTQDPTLRTLWPRPLLRSSFYWKIVGWDRKYDLADRIEARAGGASRTSRSRPTGCPSSSPGSSPPPRSSPCGCAPSGSVTTLRVSRAVGRFSTTPPRGPTAPVTTPGRSTRSPRRRRG